MSVTKTLYKHLPSPLPAKEFTILFGEYLEGRVPRDEIILACMARSLVHLEFVYTTNNLTLSDLEEAYSQVALKIVELLNTEAGLAGVRSPAAYIFNITKNILIDLYRTKTKEETLHMLDTLARESQERDYVDLIDTLCVIAHDNTDESILKMRAQGITNREISGILGVSASTVSLRLSNLYRRYQTMNKEANNE